MGILDQFLTTLTLLWRGTGWLNTDNLIWNSDHFRSDLLINHPPSFFSHSNSSHTHYDTDFPELTSKFESFGLHSSDQPPAAHAIQDLF